MLSLLRPFPLAGLAGKRLTGPSAAGLNRDSDCFQTTLKLIPSIVENSHESNRNRVWIEFGSSPNHGPGLKIFNVTVTAIFTNRM